MCVLFHCVQRLICTQKVDFVDERKDANWLIGHVAFLVVVKTTEATDLFIHRNTRNTCQREKESNFFSSDACTVEIPRRILQGNECQQQPVVDGGDRRTKVEGAMATRR